MEWWSPSAFPAAAIIVLLCVLSTTTTLAALDASNAAAERSGSREPPQMPNQNGSMRLRRVHQSPHSHSSWQSWTAYSGASLRPVRTADGGAPDDVSDGLWAYRWLLSMPTGDALPPARPSSGSNDNNHGGEVVSPPPSSVAPASSSSLSSSTRDSESTANAAGTGGTANATTTTTTTLLWCSTGGGWRAMAADMGFANSFASLGLFPSSESSSSPPSPPPSPAPITFDGVSANSGGGWAVLQLFFSSQFYDAAALGTPESLHDFVLGWMEQYQSVWPDDPPANPECEVNGPMGGQYGPIGEELTFACNSILYFDMDWSVFVTDMLDAAAAWYGTANLTDIPATTENKILQLKDVGLNVQLSLSPSARDDENELLTFLGPMGPNEAGGVGAGGDEEGAVYTVPLPMQWEMRSSSDDDGNVIGNDAVGDDWVPKGTFSSLKAYLSPSPSNFSIDDYAHFPLYPPGPEDGLLARLSDGVAAHGDGAAFEAPLGDESPTTGWVASATSAAVANGSGGCPVPFAQSYSLLTYEFDQLAKVKQAPLQRLLDATYQSLWNSTEANSFSVCGKDLDEPNEGCLSPGSRFMDGFFTDNPSVALTVGRYQRQSDDNSHRRQQQRLKVILTNTNMYHYSSYDILLYWNCTLNENVDPGEFFWLERGILPAQSKQIFSERMTHDEFVSAEVPIKGTNLTTAVYDATTIDNPVYGVVGGQKVSLLMISIHSNIPTAIIGKKSIEEYAEPLASLAETIASSSVLRDRIDAFIYSHG